MKNELKLIFVLNLHSRIPGIIRIKLQVIISFLAESPRKANTMLIKCIFSQQVLQHKWTPHSPPKSLENGVKCGP